MITAEIKQPTTEVAKRAWEIYDQRLKQLLEPDDTGKFLVIDIDSGDYEIDADEVVVMLRAAERFPPADASVFELVTEAWDKLAAICFRLGRCVW